jgi:DNA-binding CsgD family transcriptional regulator
MTTVPATAPSTRPPTLAGQVITLHGAAELKARAGHLMRPAAEFICAATDTRTWSTVTSQGAALTQAGESLSAGVRLYKLFTPCALDDPLGAEHIRLIAAAGARVRISSAPLPHETIIVDSRIAILAGGGTGPERDFSVITVPDVVDNVRSLVLSAWQNATDLADHEAARVPHIDQHGLTILRTLSEGQKDETAARQLGLSVRTYRRRVAELMDALGASSRFQAGVRARELGLRV